MNEKTFRQRNANAIDMWGLQLLSTYSDGQVRRVVFGTADKMHRTDGPAHLQFWPNGKIASEGYYKNGQLYRLDGPAVVEYNRSGKVKTVEYWLHGRLLPKNVMESVKSPATAIHQLVEYVYKLESECGSHKALKMQVKKLVTEHIELL